MSASELITYSAGYQAQLVRDRAVSARELTEAHLAHIAAVDPAIGAYLTVDGDGALDQAGAIDRALARGDELGPLAGVPLALKDMLITEGLATTAGSRILDGWCPPYDGTAVRKLKDAGMVLLGKLNLDEFAMGSSTENSAFAVCRNPWDLDRVPGGSSGGSAAAVAACSCAGALGTDTGGSVRQPAAFCGVVGLKPTYGRVSRYGVIAFASSFDQIGPIGRTVADVALLLEVIAGHDPRDATSIDAPVPRYRDALDRDVRGLRIGLPREYFSDAVQPEVSAAVNSAIEVYRQLGADVVEISLPHTRYALPTYYLLAPAEASSNLARYDGVRYGARATPPAIAEVDADADASARRSATGLTDMYEHTRGQGFGPEVKRRIMLGTFALRSGYYDAYYRKAQQVRALIKCDFDRALSDVDILLSPTAPTAAFRLGEKTTDPVEMYLADIFTLGASLAGLPGLSVPCGLTADTLPVGVQLIGRPLAEDVLIGAAAAYERAVAAVDERGVPTRLPSVLRSHLEASVP